MHALTYPAQFTESCRVIHLGRLNVHTDATVLTTSVGKGITWTREAAGLYRATLTTQYTGVAPSGGIPMLAFVQLVRSATTSAVKAVEIANQTVSNGYIEIRTLDAAGAAVDETTTAFAVNLFVIHANTTQAI